MNDKRPYPEIYSIFSKYGGPNYPYQPASYVYQPLDISVMYTSIYGNINVFANKDVSRLSVNITNLECVVFPAYEYPGSIYNIYGDISAIKNCTKLVYVILANNNITGDISVIATLPSILLFNAQRTNVYGDLSSLKTYKGYYIGIAHTQVTGDIANLSNMNDKRPYSEAYSIRTKYKTNYYNAAPNQFVYQPLDVTVQYTSCYGDISTLANKDILRLDVNNP